MKNKRITFNIVLIFIFSLLSLSFYFGSKFSFEQSAVDDYSNVNKVYVEQVINNYDQDYQGFIDRLNQYNYDYIALSDENYGYIKNGVMYYRDSQYEFLDNISFNNMIYENSVINDQDKLFMYTFNHADGTIIFKAYELQYYLMNILKLDNNYLLADYSGFIIKNNTSQITTDKVLIELREYNSYVKMDAIVNDFSEKKSGINSLKFLDKEIVVAYNYLSQLDLYIVFISEEVHYMQNFVKIFLTIVLSLGVALIIFINLFISFGTTTENILKNSYRLFYMKVSKNGKIIEANKNYLAKIKSRFTNINEMEIIDAQNFRDLLANTSISVKLKDIHEQDCFIYFLVVHLKGEDYYLIGDSIKYNYKSMFDTNLDPTTMLFSKNVLIEDMGKLIKDEKSKNFYLLLVDISNFSNINNLFGADFGDKLLFEFGSRLKHIEEESNYSYYRLENDIFAIVMKDTDDFIVVKKFISKIENYFKKPLEVANSEILVTISSGILLVGKDKGPLVGAPMDLVTKAKLALNRCKQIKNQSYYLFDDELESESYDESQIINDLKSGIQNNEFEVYFQPQYDISKKAIFGFEALIRWNHPKYKSVSPMRYITIFEEKGMINLLGDFITRETFAFANKYLKNRNWHISVNVSPVQIMQPGFVHNFLQEYDKYDFKSGQVAIEITENFIIKNKNEVISKLNILRQKGIHVHIDDFGTGYSSLLYLKDLPIDAIKLDYQFTKLIDMDEKSRLIVSHIIEIAKNLELEVVAEGVETETQQTFLLKNKCSIIQGYFIAKPMNLTDTLAFIAKEEKKKEVNK